MSNKRDAPKKKEAKHPKIVGAERQEELKLNPWVWFYYDQGFSIIPLKEKDKRPNIPTWKKYIHEQPTKEEIQEWIDKKLFKNIGVVCGAVSDNLVVIDIDDKKIIDEIGIKLNKVIESGSWVVETGRGYHIYYKYDVDPGDLRKDAETKLEYRANGGYVVAPPSIHPSGKKYHFLNFEKPEELPKLTVSDVKALFEDMVYTVKEKRGIETERAEKPPDMENIEADCIKNVFKGGLTEGKRNDTAFALANYYKHVKELNPTETKSLLRDWNKRNKDPLPSNELNTVVNSALKSDKSTGCKKFRDLGFCPFEDDTNCTFLYPQGNKEQRQQWKQRQQTIIIKGCGGVYEDLVIEPLGNLRYLYNCNNKRGVAKANYEKETNQFTIVIENETYFFKDQPLKKVIFEVPSEEKIQKYIRDEYNVKTSLALFNDMLKYSKIFWDVSPEYYPLIAVGNFQSWLRAKLPAVFYIGFTAKHGGAKTVFLEGLSILSRHGLLTGNITSAGVGRLTEKYELTLFADEIDVRTKSKDNETYEVFRTGYRRNNPYIRLKDSKNNFDEDICDTFGFKAFSVHSEIEKALKSRTIEIPLRTSQNTKLPILNLYKKQIGKPLFEDLFFWYMENVVNLVASVSISHFDVFDLERGDGNGSNKPSVASVSTVPSDFDLREYNIEEIRQKLFNEITKEFTESELNTLLKFFGRNAELLYIAIVVCKALKIDVAKELEKTFTYKSENEDLHSDHYLIGLLRELLINIYNSFIGVSSPDSSIIEDLEIHQIKEGEFKDCIYCGKTTLYEKFRILLKNKDVKPVSPGTFAGYLLELGFNDNINIKKERFGEDGKKLLKALIFDGEVLHNIGIKNGATQRKNLDSFVDESNIISDNKKKLLDETEKEINEDKNEEKTLLNDYDSYILNIEELLKTKPKTDWKINDICHQLGIGSLSARKEITALLEKTTSNPKNKTLIQKADENGLFWRLREVIK